MITANEIAEITGANEKLDWKEETATNGYYLDGEKGSDESWQTQISDSNNVSQYYWLFDRTFTSIKYGGIVSDSTNSGYWTSSANFKISSYSWYVRYNGHINYNSSLTNSERYGVRPVIEVLKSNL